MIRQEGSVSFKYPKIAHLPESSWFDIEGDCTSKHWVPQQGLVACDIYSQLAINFADPKELDVFFITPFKAVKERFAKKRKNRNTHVIVINLINQYSMFL